MKQSTQLARDKNVHFDQINIFILKEKYYVSVCMHQIVELCSTRAKANFIRDIEDLELLILQLQQKN